MNEIREGVSPIPPRVISLRAAKHFDREGFSGNRYVEPEDGVGYSALHVEVHGKHPRKKMVGATRSYMVLEGEGTFTLNCETFKIKKGDLFIVPDGAEYEYEGNMELFEFNVPGTTSANSITLDPK